MTEGPGTPFTDADGTAGLRFERHLPDAVDDVWAAVAESRRSARWIAAWGGVPGTGRTIQVTMTGEDGATAEDVLIVACEAPLRLVLDWQVPGEALWRLELTLRPSDGGTRLEFVHRGATSGDVELGWRFYLDRLVATLRRDPLPQWEGYGAAT